MDPMNTSMPMATGMPQETGTPMSAGMSMAGNGSLIPLDPSQFDLSNDTQAADFLMQMLNDAILQYDAQSYARYFWYGMLAFIGIVAAHNLSWRGVIILRKRAAARNRSTASRFGPITTVTNVCRAVSYPQLTPSRASFWVRVPPLGTIIMLLAYIGFLLALEFINNDVAGAQYWTSLGIRAGWLAVAQVPLLVLLTGKNNLIGLVTGSSYARLNILHRWVSRSILLMACLHVGYQNYGWQRFGIRSLEWSTDLCPPTGVATFALLLWLNLSTLAPIRNWCYELFVIQHLVTFFGFIIAIMLHLPPTALETRTYIWTPIGLYCFDRLLRSGRLLWHSARAGRATVVAIDDEVAKITVHETHLRNWAPGSYVLLSIPKYGVLQSHPATIVSTPTSHDGDLIFLLRARQGFTKRLLSTPNISTTSHGTSLDPSSDHEKAAAPQESHRAFIDGPYGGTHGDFAAFDTVLLMAGSTGITFILSILLDLADRAGHQKLPLRRLEVVWVVKSRLHKSWLSSELTDAFARLHTAGIEATFRVFVTSEDRVTTSTDDSSQRSAFHCDVSNDQPCSGVCLHATNGLAHTSPSLSFASDESGRPAVTTILRALVPQAQSEVGVAVCGPLGLSKSVRNAVALLTISAKHSIYLHVEGFGW